MFFPEIPGEYLERFQAVLGLRAFLVDQAARRLFHRRAGLSSFSPEPGLVPGIDVADGDAGAQAGASCSVGSLSTVFRYSRYAIRSRGSKA